MSRMSENVGASTSRNPKGLHELYRDNYLLHEDARHCTHHVPGAVFSYNLNLDYHGEQRELLRREHASV
jgi:hypothetical protein